METTLKEKKIIYPESDGEPMAENTRQFEWLVLIKQGLESGLIQQGVEAFVAGDLFWYPVEGSPGIRLAPDVMVALGRPPGHRGSYKQWEENNVAPQVVFEVLSPGNRPAEMFRKHAFYQRYGVQEYYIYNPEPEAVSLAVFIREGNELILEEFRGSWQSPLLGIVFEMGEELRLYYPNGRPFLNYEELLGQAEQERIRAEQERVRAEQERLRAEQAEAELAQLREKLRQAGLE